MLRVHPADDLIIALEDLPAGRELEIDGQVVVLPRSVAAKHKFAGRHLSRGQRVRMYGVTVGVAQSDIPAGSPLTTENVVHAVDEVSIDPARRRRWSPPDVSRWKQRTFGGFHRPDGRVGTANYWVFVPLVFCENRNIAVIRDAMLTELGYRTGNQYQQLTRTLIERRADGSTPEAIVETTWRPSDRSPAHRVFPNIDGVKFLSHSIGCGGMRDDATTLCGLLAGYINHPNVAGATVLSLGCQNAQVSLLQQQLHERNPTFDKPLLIFEQQKLGTEQTLIVEAIKHTFAALMKADELHRRPAPLSELVLGVECGGSDGFSGISANPAIGYCADLIVALGGSVILSEFPELAGAEQDLVDRCVDDNAAERFMTLMRAYNDRAVALGSGFDRNPSPGNIADGLITDAMKSCGAARKGGTSPVVDALDYPRPIRRRGLSLLCTPGGDVESTTAMAGSGATVMAFSTGLGTPTGNPITPTLKISTNTALADRMPDIIDLDAGPIIGGAAGIEQLGEQLLDLIIATAEGAYVPKAVALGQDDFIPWKRGVSL